MWTSINGLLDQELFPVKVKVPKVKVGEIKVKLYNENQKYFYF